MTLWVLLAGLLAFTNLVVFSALFHEFAHLVAFAVLQYMRNGVSGLKAAVGRVELSMGFTVAGQPLRVVLLGSLSIMRNDDDDADALSPFDFALICLAGPMSHLLLEHV